MPDFTPYLMQIDHTYYIAGPMSGRPENNYPAFRAMEQFLRSNGVRNIKNPVAIADGDMNRAYDYFIREGLKMVTQSNAMVMLDGWESSRGARLEFHTALVLGFPIFDQRMIPIKYTNLDTEQCGHAFAKIEKALADKPEEKDESICQIADRIVSCDRQNYYGHPFDNFTDIGTMWSVQLRKWDKKGPIPPEIVGLMMVSVKLCREINRPHRDNLVDGAGYFKTVDLIKQKRTADANLSHTTNS